MTKLNRGIAIATVAAASVLGGVSLAAVSGAQDAGTTTTTASTQSAPTQGAPNQTAPNQQGSDQAPKDCARGGDHHRGPNLDVAAKAIGISTDDLRSALQDGSTMAEVAQAHNVDPQKVIDALVADVKAHLDEQVSSGDLTQAQADQRLADKTQEITDHVQNGKPDRPAGPNGQSDQTPDN